MADFPLVEFCEELLSQILAIEHQLLGHDLLVTVTHVSVDCHLSEILIGLGLKLLERLLEFVKS